MCQSIARSLFVCFVKHWYSRTNGTACSPNICFFNIIIYTIQMTKNTHTQGESAQGPQTQNIRFGIPFACDDTSDSTFQCNTLGCGSFRCDCMRTEQVYLQFKTHVFCEFNTFTHIVRFGISCRYENWYTQSVSRLTHSHTHLVAKHNAHLANDNYVTFWGIILIEPCNNKNPLWNEVLVFGVMRFYMKFKGKFEKFPSFWTSTKEICHFTWKPSF